MSGSTGCKACVLRRQKPAHFNQPYDHSWAWQLWGTSQLLTEWILFMKSSKNLPWKSFDLLSKVCSLLHREIAMDAERLTSQVCSMPHRSSEDYQFAWQLLGKETRHSNPITGMQEFVDSHWTACRLYFFIYYYYFNEALLPFWCFDSVQNIQWVGRCSGRHKKNFPVHNLNFKCSLIFGAWGRQQSQQSTIDLIY